MRFNIKSSLLALAFAIFALYNASAQAPQAIRYQGVARDMNGDPIVSKNITVNLSIIDNSVTGDILYQETHKVTTSPLGLYNLSIGTGTPVKGKFSEINWAGGDKFLGQEVDFGSGFENMGTSQLLSVPFALYAASGNPGPAGTNGKDGKDGISIKWMGTLTSPPTDPTMNQAYYNSKDKKSYIYSGSSWQILTQDGTNALISPGTAAGNTPYWDGTGWVTNSSNIFNDGANIGIGKTDPAEKLDVKGNVIIPAANEYKYAGTKQKYFSVPGNAFTFQPYSTVNATTKFTTGPSSGNYKSTSGGTNSNEAYMFAPVFLPDGAVVKQVNFFVNDNDALLDVSGNFMKISFATNLATTLAYTSYTAGTPTYTTIAGTSTSVIDNSLNAYYLRFNTYENSPELKILGATIIYTVTKVD